MGSADEWRELLLAGTVQAKAPLAAANDARKGRLEPNSSNARWTAREEKWQ